LAQDKKRTQKVWIFVADSRSNEDLSDLSRSALQIILPIRQFAKKSLALQETASNGNTLTSSLSAVRTNRLNLPSAGPNKPG
jgi:hypothetical protein